MKLVPLQKAKFEVWFDSIIYQDEAINCRTGCVY